MVIGDDSCFFIGSGNYLFVLSPSFQFRYRPCGQPCKKAVDAAFFHLFDAKLLHFFRRINFRRCKKSTVCIAHGTVFFADGSVFFGAPSFLVFLKWKATTLANGIVIHEIQVGVAKQFYF